MCLSYICNRSSSDFGNFFSSYLEYRACTLLLDLLRRTTIARQLGSHSTLLLPSALVIFFTNINHKYLYDSDQHINRMVD